MSESALDFPSRYITMFARISTHLALILFPKLNNLFFEIHLMFRRGLLTSIQPGALFLNQPATLIADYSTAPPADQIIKTDPTSLLIRTLQTRKAREEAKRRKGKRAAPDGGDANKPQTKRANSKSAATLETATTAQAGPSTNDGAAAPAAANETSNYSRAQLASKTVKDLQAILKTLGCPTSGRKDDLIDRILEKQGGGT